MLFFLLFVMYCRCWGITPYLALLGASALAWALPNTYGAGMLRIPLYTDYVLYLAAAIAMTNRRWYVLAACGGLLLANLGAPMVALRAITMGASFVPEAFTWPAVAGTLGLLPLLALLTYLRWPRTLQVWGVLLLAPVLLMRAAPALSLIPYLALVAVPGVLIVLQAGVPQRTGTAQWVGGDTP